MRYWGITVHKGDHNEYWILKATGKTHRDSVGDKWRGWTVEEVHDNRTEMEHQIKRLTGEWHY